MCLNTITYTTYDCRRFANTSTTSDVSIPEPQNTNDVDEFVDCHIPIPLRIGKPLRKYESYKRTSRVTISRV